MKRSQADRSVIAQRAGARTSTVRSSTVGTNPALRVQTTVTPTGVVRRTRCAPMTAMQRDSTGRRSAWAASPYYFTDPKWSATCTG